MSVIFQCNRFEAAKESMLRKAMFQMNAITVNAGAPDTVDVFELAVIDNKYIISIDAGALSVQTSDSGEAAHAAPQSAVADALLTCTDGSPIDETVDNGTGIWTYTWTINLTLVGGTVVTGHVIMFTLESPFNNVI